MLDFRVLSQGCVVGWDVAHAVGNTPLNLHDWDVDFAAWCSYKYLNGSPGGRGAIFVHENHARSTKNVPKFNGWWSDDDKHRFSMTNGKDLAFYSTHHENPELEPV